MGRSPCCEKLGLKKGPWTPEEDQKLLAYIEEYGHGSWRALPPKAGLQRCGKSCRLRWTNYLRPDIKRGKFTPQEEQSIIQLHALLGNRWSAIATHLPKRTDNEIKNYWNTHLKKRLTKMGIDPVTHKPKSDALSSVIDGQSKNSANLSHMAQWESARLEAEARLARESKIIKFNTSLVQQRPNSGSLATDSSPSSSAQLLNKMATQPAAQALCLDVLRAWQGMKREATLSGSILGLGSNQDFIESPTSTLSSTDNSIPLPHMGFEETSRGGVEFAEDLNHFGGIMKEECDEDWKGYEKCVDDVVSAVDGQWTFEPPKIGDGQEPVLHFGDGFTDLLLGHEPKDQEMKDGSCHDPTNADLETGKADEFDHENKNYWNNVFNLVTTSPSKSHEF
ncbi:hypothetical protein MKW98_017672 [Papaver atlanticum]|uniref:Uncharacterized protein n=1 Tax=Papaver atlanticum TaxID=357466 RepID=A0AAD4TBP3_9MAGN|nr:hypothetical protein MKW98_017672 [Papaver atlanticum]